MKEHNPFVTRVIDVLAMRLMIGGICAIVCLVIAIMANSTRYAIAILDVAIILLFCAVVGFIFVALSEERKSDEETTNGDAEADDRQDAEADSR